MSSGKPTKEGGEIQRLRSQIDDLCATLSAIRNGDVDALVRDEAGVVQLYSRTTADRPYRLIVEQMGEGAATLTPGGRILFTNRQLAELLLRDQCHLIGRSIQELVTADQQPNLQMLLAVNTGHSLSLPLELLSSAAMAVPVLASISGLELSGEVVLCLITTDLSRILKAEQALVASELSFRMLALNAQDGILILNWESGTITLANPYLCQLLGLEPTNLIGRPIWEIGAFDDQQRAHELFIELKDKGMVRYDDMPLKCANGELKEVEFVSNVYLSGQERVIQCNIRDISDRKAAERIAQLRQADVQQGLEDIVAALVVLSEARDPYTAGHQSRVADLAAAIGHELGLDDDQLRGLHISAQVHDIGKLTIPSQILTKPTTLKPQEMELIRTHVQEGYEVLSTIHFPWPVAEAVLQHHERLDGSGYPRGLQGEAIGLWGRILAVADTVEAMSTDRPYRFNLGIDAALETIEAGQGSLFDPAVVEACLRLFREQRYQLTQPAP